MTAPAQVCSEAAVPRSPCPVLPPRWCFVKKRKHLRCCWGSGHSPFFPAKAFRDESALKCWLWCLELSSE